jgi:large subunit ribosomal protein L15
MKVKKRKKVSRMSGRKAGTHGRGARKKAKGSGHRGGKGWSGSGKRADHKKTKITKLYGSKYFGKSGITSKRSAKDKRKRINLYDIVERLQKFKKSASGYEIELKGYKILGKGEVKEKLIIKSEDASKLALEKVEKAGGKIICSKNSKSKSENSIEESELKSK